MVGMLSVDIALGPFVPVVYRMEWAALPAKGKVALSKPISYIRITYTGGKSCIKHSECMKIVQDTQEQDVLFKNLPDIASNFLVSGDGIVYEGRGWNVEPYRGDKYSHLKGKCLDFAYIGDYSTSSPRWEMIRSVMDMIQYGVKHGMITPTFKIINYNQ